MEISFSDFLLPTCLRDLELVRVVGHSMYPYFGDGDLAILRAAAPTRTLIQRGWIVAFDLPTSSGHLLIKRVVGVQGDRVEHANGLILTVPQHHIYVLGANPSWSVDSRQVGPINCSRVVGTIIARVPGPRRHPPAVTPPGVPRLVQPRKIEHKARTSRRRELHVGPAEQ